MAFASLKIDKFEFSKDELLELIQESRLNCGIIQFKDSNFLKDLISTVPLFTIEGSYYRWTHKSIYEYFCCKFIHQDTRLKRGEILKSLVYRKDSIKYYNMLDIYSHLDFKSYLYEIAYLVVKEFIEYCDSTYKNSGIKKILIRERQSLEFPEVNYIVKLKPSREKEFWKEAFELTKEVLGENHELGMAVTKYHNKRESCGNCVILSKRKYDIFQSILDQIRNKYPSLMVDFPYDNAINMYDLKIEENKLLPISDSKEHKMNTRNNFEIVNNVLKAYSHHLKRLELEKCKEFVQYVERENKPNSENSFLSI